MSSPSLLAAPRLATFAPLACVAALALLPACSGDDPPSDAGGAGAGTQSGGGTDPGAGGADPGTGGGGGSAWDPGGPITPIHAKMGPVHVDAGGEDTECITFRLGNTDQVNVRRFSTTLAQGTHHMILYRSNDTTENLTPTPCGGFSGLLEGDHPIFIAQQAHSVLEMPTDEENQRPVALQIDGNQMVRVEMHFFNTGTTDLDVAGDIELDTVPLATEVTAADIAFWGTQNINIPANGEGDTGVLFQRALSNTHSFAVTTHQHHLGTEMKVWYGTSVDAAKQTPVVDSFNWQDPPLVMFNPTLDYGTGPNGETLSQQGLAFQCHWQNPTSKDVGFGESINDEMCFLWQYYYPSQGFQACLTGLGCKGGF